MDPEKKKKLLCSLKQKMKLAGFSDAKEEDKNKVEITSGFGNKNAAKQTRKIIIGWIHEGKPVRLKTGGGSRSVIISKAAKKTDIIEEGKRLFFRGGASKRGRMENLIFDVLDFQLNIMSEDETVGELYVASSVPLLRFYISTTNAIDVSVDETCDVDADTLPDLSPTDFPDDIFDCDLSEIVVPDESLASVSAPALSDEIIECTSSRKSPCTPTQDSRTSLTSSHSSTVSMYGISADREPALSVSDELALPLLSCGRSFAASTPTPSEQTRTVDNDVRFVCSPTLSEEDSDLEYVECVARIVCVNRTNILEELVATFKDPSMAQSTIKFQFINEKGSDENGVSRDVYTCFWGELFCHATDGEIYRVPAVYNGWNREEWSAVGRILFKGFNEHGIFPLKLAPAFFVNLVFGEDHVSTELILDSFMKYLGEGDATIINAAVSGTLEDDDRDTFVEILSRLGCHRIPNGDKIKACIIETGHAKLLQETNYIKEYLAKACRSSFRKSFKDVSAIIQMYEAMKPTPKKVVKLFSASPSTIGEEKAFQFLCQYTSAQANDSLGKLLRFLTGADIICVKDINIQFTNLLGTGRRPIAHCCGPVLELPSTYSAYRQLRSEFDGILSSDICFTMDIC